MRKRIYAMTFVSWLNDAGFSMKTHEVQLPPLCNTIKKITTEKSQRIKHRGSTAVSGVLHLQLNEDTSVCQRRTQSKLRKINCHVLFDSVGVVFTDRMNRYKYWMPSASYSFTTKSLSLHPEGMIYL
jgi:hypothetical protein